MSTAAVTETALGLTLRASSAQAPGTVCIALYLGPSQLGAFMQVLTPWLPNFNPNIFR